MLPALWALLLSDVRLTSRLSAPRFGDARSALLRGGARSQREWSDSEADALWENVSTVWADVSELWNRTRREEALLVAAAHATPLLLELGERIPAGEYSLPLDESMKLTLLEMLDGSKLTLAARRPRRIRKPELAALAQALLDALGSQLTVAALGAGRRWGLPSVGLPPGHIGLQGAWGCSLSAHSAAAWVAWGCSLGPCTGLQPGSNHGRWVLPPDGTRLEFNASAVRLLGPYPYPLALALALALALVLALALALSLTLTRCGCWASGATARTRRRSGSP